MEIDGSFSVTVDRTAWGDISLTLSRHDLQIHLDPVEAARICRDVRAALGHGAATDDGRAA
jgi:hypothetical protein